ncbi:39S ribosomal protein L4, mitochondrial-like [Mytilus californianus]|uniref:39S ribosomal protein L4, mitochondrial-like n=1 Tax=Mytilus californianus TaxID=6549 RepID=UPI0022467F7D|nr:39S ribosomal protein L4, mitochondrial-like [Mytilus californianus]
MFCPKHIFCRLNSQNLKNLFTFVAARNVTTTRILKAEDKTDVTGELETASDPHLYVPDRPPLPIVTSRQLEYPSEHLPSKQAWLDTMATLEEEKLGIVDLHPKIFGTYPRIDILHNNVDWQRKYRFIDYSFARSRAEMPGGGKKPHPQKKTGRARQGSIRSPIYFRGGKALGPRGPKSFFYMLPKVKRVHGLCCALSAKYAQNKLIIVDSLEIPKADQQFLEDLIDVRFWGFSVLFVDDSDIMPRNFSLAVNQIPHFNAMPVYGLNVYSMLKHETLVLTLAAVEKIESKLLQILYSAQKEDVKFEYNE